MQPDKISNIRALAIMAVVLGHSIILYSSEWNIYETTRQCAFLDSVKTIINLFQMQIFFLISGYLFHATIARSNGFKDFCRKKFQRLIEPYLLFGLLWMIPIKMAVRCPGYDAGNVGDVLYAVTNLFTGQNNGHLWFLYSLFSIFVIEYLLVKITRGNRWINVAMLIVFLCLSQVSCSIGYFNIPLTLVYLPWFHLGYILALDKKYQWQIATAIVFVTVSLLYHNISLLFSLAIVLGICYAMPSRHCGILDFISRHSYGIYLFHSPLIYITFAYLAESNPITVVLMNLIVFGFNALILSVIIKKQEYVRI